MQEQTFEDLYALIDERIAELGGAVTPKLNWSCPKDAMWITTGHTHRCTNAEEVNPMLPAATCTWWYLVAHALRITFQFSITLRTTQSQRTQVQVDLLNHVEGTFTISFVLCTYQVQFMALLLLTVYILYILNHISSSASFDAPPPLPNLDHG